MKKSLLSQSKPIHIPSFTFSHHVLTICHRQRFHGNLINLTFYLTWCDPLLTLSSTLKLSLALPLLTQCLLDFCSLFLTVLHLSLLCVVLSVSSSLTCSPETFFGFFLLLYIPFHVNQIYPCSFNYY